MNPATARFATRNASESYRQLTMFHKTAALADIQGLRFAGKYVLLNLLALVTTNTA